MIPEQIILFVLMTLLSYVFGNRLVPQSMVMLLAVFEILSIATGAKLSITDAYYILLFIVNLGYAGMCMVVKERD